MRVSADTIEKNIDEVWEVLGRRGISTDDVEQSWSKAVDLDRLYISPFERSKKVDPVSNLSYGLTYAGYDLRLSKISLPDKELGKDVSFFALNNSFKNTSLAKSYIDVIADHVKIYRNMMWRDPVEAAILMPSEFCLGSVLEWMHVPTNMDGALKDKSSLARIGLQVQNTVVEPGWHGYLTVELVNQSHFPIHLYNGMPIGQMQFTLLDKPANRYSGKYQGQSAVPVGAK